MARGGTKFPLIVYRHLLSRWWTPMIAMGLGLFGIAYGQYLEPLGRFLPMSWLPFVAIGILSILIGIFFLIIRQIAYVQPFPTHLKFVTPFLRLNISYKRIHKTTATEMRQLFPPKSMSGWMRDIFAPLAGQTAVIIELKAYPISPVVLRLFLSKFFFKDKSPHFVILVKDWMKFSNELDSMKSGVDLNPPVARKPQRNSILSKLPQK
ncbi:MAG TPA: hypothetical protein VN653_20520 [Anaerolineales bacterium]|nr:hypothetical protein [Anaerolineales bacterium]